MVKLDGNWINPSHVALVVPYNQGTSKIYIVGAGFGAVASGTPDEVVVALRLATPGFSKDLPTPQTKVHKTVDQLLQEHPNLMTAVKVLLDAVMVTPAHASFQTLANWDEARKQ